MSHVGDPPSGSAKGRVAVCLADHIGQHVMFRIRQIGQRTAYRAGIAPDHAHARLDDGNGVALSTIADIKIGIEKFGQCAAHRGVIVTAKGSGRHDFVSRWFGPRTGVDEDPELDEVWRDEKLVRQMGRGIPDVLEEILLHFQGPEG